MKTKQPEQFDDIAFRKSLSGEEAFQARTRRGMQPVIDIAGWPYYINVRWNLLEPRMLIDERKVRPTINLETECYHDFKTGNFSLYYDTKKQEPFEVFDEMTRLPKNVVFVKIPNLFKLDPVGMARENEEQDPRAYLNKYPLKLYHTAKVVELEHSPLAHLVNKNKQALQKQRSARKVVDQGPKGQNRS